MSKRTRVGWLNFWILQWFGIRLYYALAIGTKEITEFGIQFPVVPLTGWRSNYIPRQPRIIPLLTRKQIKEDFNV